MRNARPNPTRSLNPLHPRITIVWRVSGLSGATALAVTIGALEMLVLAPRGIFIGATGVLTGTIAALALTLALVWPTFRYRAWRWQVDRDRVLIQKGVIWRSRSLIPRVRIQHVDTRNSPLQRWLGLSSLVIYTAGTRGADAEIPGLAADQAEQLREELAQLTQLEELDATG